MEITNALAGVLMVFSAYIWIWYFVGFGSNKYTIFLQGAAFAILLGDVTINHPYGLPRTLTAVSAFLVMWVAGIRDKKIQPVNKTLDALDKYFNEDGGL